MHHITLRQLQHHPLRRTARLTQNALHQLDKPRFGHLAAGYVDRNEVQHHAGSGPGLQPGAGLAQHPFTQRQDQPAVLGQGDELRRGNPAQFGMVPPRQGFYTHTLH